MKITSQMTTFHGLISSKVYIFCKVYELLKIVVPFQERKPKFEFLLNKSD